VNASVSLKIFGKEHPVETDAEGNFVLELKGPLPVGTHVIEASAKNPRTRYVQRGWVTIFPPDGGTVVISSVRHTMVRASRLCKAILALSPQSVLLARPRHLKTCTRVYPGVLETVSRWNKEKQPVVFISDLPADSYVLFRRVLKVHGFPKIPLVFAGRSIKDLTKRARILLKAELISQILDLLPNHQVILVGNDVDTDVDAFALAQKKHGSRIDNVYIHRVPFRSDHQKLKPGQKRIASFREIRKIHR
jgi:phosphatidate phosphatase APP1